MKKVDCVVLAGGFGTRLSPLTDSKPKPLVKILDKSVLENVIDCVKRTDVEKIILSTFYKSDMIEALCRKKYPDVICKREAKPLGTAGGVKNCFDSTADALLVVSGDAVFDFDLQAVIDYHFKRKADATVVVSRKDDPTGFGVVISDDDGNITLFDEKPAWKNVKSNAVNTGIYVLSKDVFREIPDNEQYDFSKNLFPELMADGKSVTAYFADGFWCDVGTLDEYFACNRLAAKGGICCIPNEGSETAGLNKCGIHADDGIYVAKSVKVGKNVRIGEESIVCDGVVVGDNCDIVCSVVGGQSIIGKGCSINGAIIGERVSVGENCIVPEGTVIGDGCRIADGTVMRKGRHLKSDCAVFGEDRSCMGFSNCKKMFADDGLVIVDEKDFLSKLFCFSRAVNRALKRQDGRRVRIAVTCGNGAECVKNLFCSLLTLDNAVVFDCGEANEAMCIYAVKKLETDASVHIGINDKKTQLRLFSPDGKPADTELERKIVKICSLLDNEEEIAPESNGISGETVCVDLRKMYESSVLCFAENILGNGDLSGMLITMLGDEVETNPSSGTLKNVLNWYNCPVVSTGNKKTVNISISADGRRVRVRYDGKELDSNHVCAAVMKNMHLVGENNVKISEEAPAVLCGMMQKGKADNNMFCIDEDGAVCALCFVSVLKKSGTDAGKIFSDIPCFEIFTDEYVADVNRGATMERLYKLYHDSKDESPEGIRLKLAEGTVTVVPNRMKGFKIVAEARSTEAAKELCFKIGKAIKNDG